MLKPTRDGSFEFYSGKEGLVTLVTLTYLKGRGLYVTIQEVTLKHEDGFTSMSFTIFQNRRVGALVLKLARGNPRKLAAVAALLNTQLDEVLKRYAEKADASVLQPFIDVVNQAG